MIKRIVFDMDNTLVDEFGSTLRPGITGLLKELKGRGCELYLWTSSTRGRAREILSLHNLDRYFSKCVFREDYDPENRGVRKDIRKIGGQMLIDDDPGEIEHVKRLGLKGYVVKSYRKNSRTSGTEYRDILKLIQADAGFFKKILKF